MRGAVRELCGGLVAHDRMARLVFRACDMWCEVQDVRAFESR